MQALRRELTKTRQLNAPCALPRCLLEGHMSSFKSFTASLLAGPPAITHLQSSNDVHLYVGANITCPSDATRTAMPPLGLLGREGARETERSSSYRGALLPKSTKLSVRQKTAEGRRMRPRGLYMYGVSAKTFSLRERGLRSR